MEELSQKTIGNYLTPFFLEVDTVTTLQAQISTLIRQLSNLNQKNNSAPSSDNCNFLGYSNTEFGFGDAGMVGDGYQEQVNFVGN